MKWIKLIKYFQGGSNTDYQYVDEKDIETENQQQEIMKNWGENSDGGHAYGYKVEMNVLEDSEIPPKDWIEKKIVKSKSELKYLHNAIQRTEEFINMLEIQLKDI